MRDAIERFRAEIDGVIAAFRNPMGSGAADAMATFDMFGEAGMKDLRSFGALTNALGKALRWGLAGASTLELKRLAMTREPTREETFQIIAPRLTKAGFNISQNIQRRELIKKYLESHHGDAETVDGLLIAPSGSARDALLDALKSSRQGEWMVEPSLKRGLANIDERGPLPRVVVVEIPPTELTDSRLRLLVELHHSLNAPRAWPRHLRSHVIVVSPQMVWLTRELLFHLEFAAYLPTHNVQVIAELVQRLLSDADSSKPVHS